MSESSVKPSSSSPDTEALINPGEHEYETQFLGFGPRSLIDAVYNTVLDYTLEYFRASKDYIRSEFPDLLSEEELNKAEDTFMTTLIASLDVAFDKFEAYVLSNIFHIPSNVILPEDKVQEEFRDFTKLEEQILNDDIKKLKERIIAAKYLNTSLKKEYREIHRALDEYKRFLELQKNISRTFKEAKVLDILESLKFLTNKSTQIQSLVSLIKKGINTKKELSDTSELERVAKRLKTESSH